MSLKTDGIELDPGALINIKQNICLSDGSAPVGGQTVYFTDWGAYSAPDLAYKQLAVGKITGLRMNITTNTVSEATVFKIYKNGAAVGTGISYAATETGWKTQAEDITIADGDKICVEAVIGGNPAATIYPKEICADFMPGGN